MEILSVLSSQEVWRSLAIYSRDVHIMKKPSKAKPPKKPTRKERFARAQKDHDARAEAKQPKEPPKAAPAEVVVVAEPSMKVKPLKVETSEQIHARAQKEYRVSQNRFEKWIAERKE